MPYKDLQKRREYCKRYNQRLETKKRRRAYYHKNKEKIRQQQRKYMSKPEAQKKKKEQQKEYRSRLEVTERKRKYDKGYRQRQGFKERKNSRERYRYNTDEEYRKKELIRRRDWSKNNKDKVKEWNRTWGKNNRDKTRRYTWKRRAKERKLVHQFTNEKWLQKKRNTFGVCPHCNRFIGIDKLTIDHTPTISKAPIGFIYTIDDVTPICKPYNSSKNAT